MVSKNDCLLLLGELQDNGVSTESITKELISKDVTIDVIKFINQHRQLDLSAFYEKLRKSYNDKKSTLYINIVKDIDDPSKVLTTLAALELQILLYSKNVEDKEMFLRHARSQEISMVLANYFRSFDLTNCVKLLRIIKADLKALESVK